MEDPCFPQQPLGFKQRTASKPKNTPARRASRPENPHARPHLLVYSCFSRMQHPSSISFARLLPAQHFRIPSIFSSQVLPTLLANPTIHGWNTPQPRIILVSQGAPSTVMQNRGALSPASSAIASNI